MATEEVETDEELRELVAQTLETKGVLGKIRAELRAQVFLALEEQEKSEGRKAHSSTKLKDFLSSREGKLAAAVVREFLEFFELHFTASVFEPEAEAYELSTRSEILEQLKLQEGSDVSTNEPVVCGLVRRLAEPQPTSATISSSKLSSLLATAASHHGSGLPDLTSTSRKEPQVASGDSPITSSTFGHAHPTQAKETTTNLRSHSLAEGGTSTLGLDPKFLNASTPPLLQSSLSADHLREFPGQGESFLGNDSQGDSSRELERLLEASDHRVFSYQGKHLAGKGASTSDDILGQKPTPSALEGTQGSRQASSSSHLTENPIGGMTSSKTASGQREAFYEEDFQTESIHTEVDVEEGSNHSSKKPAPRSTVDGHTVDETLSQSDLSLGSADFMEAVAKS